MNDPKMDIENYPVSYEAPRQVPSKRELIMELCSVLKSDAHEVVAEIETEYLPDLVETLDEIWEGNLVL